MAANFDWRCAIHGDFEGPKPGKCPFGCGAGLVEMVWKQAPGYVGAQTRTTDSLRQRIADQAGITDMQSKPGRPAIPDTYRWDSPAALGNPRPYSVSIDPSTDMSQQVAAHGALDDASNALNFVEINKSAKMKYHVAGRDDDMSKLKGKV